MLKKRCTRCRKFLTTKCFYRIYRRNRYEYTSQCRLCIKEVTIINYNKNFPRASKYRRVYYKKNKDSINDRHRKNRHMQLEEVFNKLGNKCARCGLLDKRVLSIDHMNGNGGHERRLYGGSYKKYYEKILESITKNKKEYQLLCLNCNQIEGVEKGYRTSIWH